MELDGQVWRGRVQLLGAAASQVLSQDVGHDLITVIDGQDVAVAQVQAEGQREGGVAKLGAFNKLLIYFFSGNTHFLETYEVSGARLGTGVEVGMDSQCGQDMPILL